VLLRAWSEVGGGDMGAEKECVLYPDDGEVPINDRGIIYPKDPFIFAMITISLQLLFFKHS
jgi:hypothetical protein